MRRQTIVRTGVFSFAAGAALVLGGVADPAAASPPAAVPGVAADCDVSGGQPGGEHAPGGHDSHGMAGGTAPSAEDHGSHGMTGETAPPAEGHEGHGSHGTSATAVSGPSDGARQLVLGGFAGVNATALAAAGVMRRRTAARRDRHVTARATAQPARRVEGGEER